MTTHGGIVIAVAAAKLFELHQTKWRIDQAALAALFAVARITDADVWFHDAIADRLRDVGKGIPKHKRGADDCAEWMFGPRGALISGLMKEV
jgi:hypothetical protein